LRATSARDKARSVMTVPPEIPAFDGAALGRELRELIRALFDFPDPRQAVAGTVEFTTADEDHPPQQQETTDG
jgi:hypothetical protein